MPVATETLRPAIAARVADDGEVLVAGADRTVLRRAVARALAAEGVVAPPEVWAQLVRDLVDDLAGLGPLEELLRDPTVTEVMVNGADVVHLERDGRLERSDRTFASDDELVRDHARPRPARRPARPRSTLRGCGARRRAAPARHPAAARGAPDPDAASRRRGRPHMGRARRPGSSLSPRPSC
jgi:hypothetical protein